MFGRKKVADEDPFAALKEGGVYQSTPTTTVAGIPGSGLDDEPMVVPSASPIPVAPPAPAAPAAPVLAAPPAPVNATGAAPIPAAPPTSVTVAPPAASPTTQAPLNAPRRMTREPIRGARISPYGVRRVSGPGQFVVWLIVLGVIAAIVVPIISSASHAIHSFSIPSFSVPSPSIPSFSTPTPKPPKPHPRTNYLRPGATRAGLARIEKRFPGARVTNLRIDSSSMDAFVYTKGGGVKDLTMNSSGTFVSSSPGAGERPIAISAIPAGAVTRIIRAIRSRFHIPPSRIDYMVLTTVPNLPPRWITFSKGPSHAAYAAALDGSDLQKLDG